MQVHAFVHDNAAVAVKASKDGGWKYITCATHSLQLIVNRGLAEQRTLIDAVAVARKLVGHFKHSAKATATLDEIQRKKGVSQPLKILQDVPTRWNSTYYMVERLIHLCEFNRDYASSSASGSLTQPSANQWQLLEAAKQLLAPFEEITRELSRADASVS